MAREPHPDEGKRVRLVHTSDPYTDLVPGEVGTITLVDSMGTRHIQWDKGNTLGLVPGEDQWVIVDG